MSFAEKMHSRPGSVSDAVYMEIIATLYGTLVPVLFVGIAQAIVGTITARQTGDIAMAVLTALGVAVAIVRTCDFLAYRRRVDRKPRLDRAEAESWERRYAIGSGITASIIGLFAARSLTLDDAICSVMAIGIAFGFGAGVVARLSLRPIVAILGLGVTGLPVIVTTFMRPDAPHVGLGLLLTIYLVGSVEMVRLTYNSTINQMTLKQQFEQLARIDPMTGIFNRSVLDTDLVQMVAESKAGMVAIHAIDLDHFKAANDRFGHPVGDALLKQVAARLKSVSGQGDLIVRMGGDEFILVQKSVPCREDAELMAQRIFESVSAPYRAAGHDIVIGASIGVAISPDDGRTVEALLSRSDKALYRAKENRGGYIFAASLPPPASTTAPPAETAGRQLAA
jgi:diguanylate cyclase (GGDEF)-like protein